ncbi:hypothetical protein [Myxosarcina sp. GI1]|uniref:hypothetical protein n=1 Tax=Myxosarcina sp. GI1 TaxID=1541065 RepID=UPI00155A9C53|nr:hypothetical protein [Myxosarcina sp. GI1]
MNTQWEKIIFKILCWLFVEAVFNLIGIDDLIDYGEFTLIPKVMLQVNATELALHQC